MAPEELQAFEQEVCTEVQRISDHLSEVVPKQLLAVTAVDAQGTFPETEIVVTVRDKTNDRERQSAYRLWGQDWFMAQDGRMASAEHVANLIATWAHGG